MAEWLALLFLCACIAFVALLALLAWLRLSSELRELRRRLGQLERRLRETAATTGEAHDLEQAAPTEQSSARAAAAPNFETLAPSAVPASPAPAAHGAVVEAPPSVAPIPGSSRASQRPVLPSATAPRSSVDWERWFGVKGAALVGGAVLALAGLFFVQYSIQRGWIGPSLRCTLGALAGCAALLVSGPLHKRGYRVTADALAGSGVTLLFAATWAARVLYELVPFSAAFVVLVAATVCCGLLAVRRPSTVIAWFGALGGFATPLLLSLGSSTPIGLFAYLLLLELAVLALASRRGWNALSAAAVIATQVVFALWIVRFFDPRYTSWAMLFTAAISLAFSTSRGSERAPWTSWIACIVPFSFAVYFGGRAATGAPLGALALLVLLLTASASWTALRIRRATLVFAAALGAAATLASWYAASDRSPATAWYTLATLGAVALVLAGVAEIARRATDARSFPAVVAAALLPLASIPVLLEFAYGPVPLAALLALDFLFAALITRAVVIGAALDWLACAAALPTLGLASWRLAGAPELAPAVDPALCAVVLAGPWSAVRLVRREGASAALARGALVAALVVLFEHALGGAGRGAHSTAWLVSIAVATGCGVLAARVRASAAGFAAAGAAAWLAISSFAMDLHSSSSITAMQLALVLGLGWASMLVPYYDRSVLGVARNTWRAGALLALAWSWPLANVMHAWRPSGVRGIDFALLAAPALALALRRVDLERDGRRSAESVGVAWYGAVGALLAALAFRGALDHRSFTLVPALALPAFAGLARAQRHVGLRVLVLASALVIVVGLLLTAARIVDAPQIFVRTGYPVWHWLSLDVGAPALALLWAAQLARHRAADLDTRSWSALEQLPAWLSLGGVLAVFGWLNVEVVNLFSEGPRYAFELQRVPPRDVALSVSWTIYALALLVLGVRLGRQPLRWTSLGFFLATIAKVFLYDLGELRGLHRVGSLVGLAVALLSVSLLYQRFVFRAPREARAG